LPLSIGLFCDIYHPNPNGVAISVSLLARELQVMGHQVWVIAPHQPGAEPEPRVIRVPSLPWPFLAGVRLGIPTAHGLPYFDLVHTNSPSALGLLGLRVANYRRIPHVSTFHTQYEAYTHYLPGATTFNHLTRAFPRYLRWFYGQVDTVIAPTQPIADLVRGYGIKSRLEVIPTGIDLTVLERSPLPPSPWPAGKRRLLTVGRLGKEKSVDVVIKAAATLARNHDIHLVIIGYGPEESNLRHLAEALGIAERVTFLGTVPYEQIGGYYRLAELFLFASETETQGLVIWEAQALGLPVVAVAAGGVPDGLTAGVTGELVAPGDYTSMAQKAGVLLAQEDLRQKYSQAALSSGRGRSPTAVARKILGIYQDLLQSEPSAEVH
jgi:glycosyltransferase involved in cell wall biosynthesis